MKNLQISTSKKILLTMMGFLTVLIISYAFYLSLTLYSYFIIGRDEANFLLRSSMAIFSAETFTDSIKQLFQIHGQHVLVGMQLANLLSFLTFGSLDFQFINFIGLLYLVIPTLLICTHLKLQNHPAQSTTAFIIAAAITFPLALSPAHISCAINTACTGNHYLGMGLAIIALYFFIPFSSQKITLSKVVIAEFFVLLAIFSSPAALAIVPLFFGIILFFNEKKLSILLLHILSSLVILSIYFSVAESADFSFLHDPSFRDILKIIFLFCLFFFNLLGSVFFWPEHISAAITSVTLGFAITTIGLWAIKSHAHQLKQRPDLLFFASGFLLLLGMIGLIALGRMSSLGSTRYVFYGAFALIFLLLFLIASGHVKRSIPIALFCLAYYPAQLLLNQPYIDRIRGEIIACNENWYAKGHACGVMMKHAEATALLLEAERQGILRLPHR